MTRRSLLHASALLAGSFGSQTSRASQTDAKRELRGASASLVADALREVGRDPRDLTMSSNIRPVTGTNEPVVGPAVTTKWELATERNSAASDAIRRFVFDPVDAADAGSIWVVSSGTDQLLSMFGDLIGLACQRKGMAGAVTDSGCRDVAAMQSYGLPVFAKGTVLYGPGEVIRPVAANVPVVCGGVSVRPGDVLVADVDGVIVVPKEILVDVVQAKDELLSKEDDVRRKIEDGVPLARAYSL